MAVLLFFVLHIILLLFLFLYVKVRKMVYYLIKWIFFRYIIVCSGLIVFGK